MSVALGLSLAALSATTTAFAHGFVKAGSDKLAVQAWVRLMGLAVAAPFAVWIGLPPEYLWPWLIAAAAVHAVYQAVLSWSYTVSDFSAAYPIARGIAPICTAILGVALLGDTLGMAALFGIAVVSFGIALLASGGSITARGLGAAIATGMLTTAYSLIDAKGMRLSPDLFTFIIWFFVLDGISMPLLFLAKRRNDALAALRFDSRSGLAAGVMAPVSFVPALYAFSLAPVGAVAAIRESSVLIGMLIGHRVLRETVDRKRITGATLVMIGILAILAASH